MTRFSLWVCVVGHGTWPSDPLLLDHDRLRRAILLHDVYARGGDSIYLHAVGHIVFSIAVLRLEHRDVRGLCIFYDVMEIGPTICEGVVIMCTCWYVETRVFGFDIIEHISTTYRGRGVETKDIAQARAITESLVSNRSDGVGDGYRGQARATSESILSNRGDGLGDSYRGQTFAVSESPVSNLGDGVGDGD